MIRDVESGSRVWIAFTGVHVLGHLPEILRGLRSARGTRRQLTTLAIAPAGGGRPGDQPARVDGAGGRSAALLAAMLGGLALAAALIGQSRSGRTDKPRRLLRIRT